MSNIINTCGVRVGLNDIYDIKEKHAMHLPFLIARKSNREWNRDTIMVNPRRYGFPSRKTLCSL
jgi:hypothetical protein